MIKTDHSHNDEPFMEDVISLQVVLSNNTNSYLDEKVDKALNLVSCKLEEINTKAQKEFFSSM